MRLLKPSWVTHEGHPIYSIDVHPDGSRFATGGQGADTGRIVIWNMSPVMNEDDEKDENVPKMLCQMDNHLACVNCVRWSSSGKYLASGGDDKVIMIWQTGRYGSGTSVFGSGGKTVNAEYWRCISTLRGHSGDVLDLAWSPHDAWLASCSVDNTVVIWNALKWQEIVAVLKGHTGLVKGVSWDPVGKYVASQSDDKSLRIWRTHDWQQETVLVEPFVECGGTTHVLRLSWSPDGQYLVSAHAMNNSGPTAQIIERDGWKTNKDFVGHRKAITCVRFNPNILSKVSKENGKSQCFCCCAIGSRDRSLSVWLTCLRRPLVVIHDLFSNSVLDVSWSQSGHQLVVCSWDGTVAYIDFSEEEIGKPLSPEEKGSYHQRMYGKSLAIASQNPSATVAIIENPELLKLREQQEKEIQQLNEAAAAAAPLVNGITGSGKLSDSQGAQSNRVPAQMRGPTDKQIETRLPDGRRRITPLYIPPPPDIGDTPVPFSSRTTTFSSSSEAKTKIVIEKRDESNNNLQTSLNFKHSEATSITVTTVPTTTASSTTPPRTVISNAPSVGKDVQPTPPPPPPPPPSTSRPTVVTLVSERDKQSEPKQVSVSNLPGLDSAPIHIPVKKKADATPGPGRPPEKRKPGRPPLAQSQSSIPSAEKERTSEKSLPGYNTFQLPVLKLDKSTNIHLPGEKPDMTTTIELENDVVLGAGMVVHRLRCLTNGNPSWEVLLSSRGAALAGSKHVLCVACEDSTLSMFLPSGRRLLPPVVLSSPATRVTCCGHYVMVITSKGDVSIWNTRDVKVLMNSESLIPLMQGKGTPQVTISSTALLDNGVPLITLSTGRSYTYHSEMRSWLLVSSVEDVLPQCSDHMSCLPSQNLFNGSILPLAMLQSHHQKGFRLSRSLFRSNPTVQQAGTLSHLDSQLATALSLQSGKEYKFWLLTLVRYVAQEGLESRAREICDFLLGPTHSKGGKWDPYILGLHKHDLLREALPIIGSNLKLQRMFAEYKEQLELK